MQSAAADIHPRLVVTGYSSQENSLARDGSNVKDFEFRIHVNDRYAPALRSLAKEGILTLIYHADPWRIFAENTTSDVVLATLSEDLTIANKTTSDVVRL